MLSPIDWQPVITECADLGRGLQSFEIATRWNPFEQVWESAIARVFSFSAKTESEAITVAQGFLKDRSKK